MQSAIQHGKTNINYALNRLEKIQTDCHTHTCTVYHHSLQVHSQSVAALFLEAVLADPLVRVSGVHYVLAGAGGNGLDPDPLPGSCHSTILRRLRTQGKSYFRRPCSKASLYAGHTDWQVLMTSPHTHTHTSLLHRHSHCNKLLKLATFIFPATPN